MKDDRVYLQHIRDAIENIVGYTEAGRDAFLSDRCVRMQRCENSRSSVKPSRTSQTNARRARRRSLASRAHNVALSVGRT